VDAAAVVDVAAAAAGRAAGFAGFNSYIGDTNERNAEIGH